MASIFFRLRLVPEEEAEDVRQLLEKNNIPWFETSAGRWGISFPAILLEDSDDRERACALLAKYQEELQSSQRERQRERVARGEHDTFLSGLYHHPIRSFLALAVVAVILFFSTRPFFTVLQG